MPQQILVGVADISEGTILRGVMIMAGDPANHRARWSRVDRLWLVESDVGVDSKYEYLPGALQKMGLILINTQWGKDTAWTTHANPYHWED